MLIRIKRILFIGEERRPEIDLRCENIRTKPETLSMVGFFARTEVTAKQLKK
jgi:hypothetical protein